MEPTRRRNDSIFRRAERWGRKCWGLSEISGTAEREGKKDVVFFFKYSLIKKIELSMSSQFNCRRKNEIAIKGHWRNASEITFKKYIALNSFFIYKNFEIVDKNVKVYETRYVDVSGSSKTQPRLSQILARNLNPSICLKKIKTSSKPHLYLNLTLNYELFLDKPN